MPVVIPAAHEAVTLVGHAVRAATQVDAAQEVTLADAAQEASQAVAEHVVLVASQEVVEEAHVAEAEDADNPQKRHKKRRAPARLFFIIVVTIIEPLYSLVWYCRCAEPRYTNHLVKRIDSVC